MKTKILEKLREEVERVGETIPRAFNAENALIEGEIEGLKKAIQIVQQVFDEEGER